MIKKWVKLLPYWLVIKLIRNDNQPFGTFKDGKEWKVRYIQVSEGEFVCFASDLQKIFDDRRREQRKQKLEIKKDKLMRKINKNWSLKEEMRKEFKEIEQREKEEMESDY